MLRELMGTDDTAAEELEYTDSKVCKAFLCGCCPNAMVENTKLDQGKCDKVHSRGLKTKYEEDSKSGKATGLEPEWYAHLKGFTDDTDRKTRRVEQELDRTQDMDPDLLAEGIKVQKQVEEISSKALKAEELREQGGEEKVAEATKLEEENVKSREENVIAMAAFKGKLPPGNNQQQTLRVCRVCSCKLSIVDNDERLTDHFKGKQHLSMVKIRAHIKELEDTGKRYGVPRSGSSGNGGGGGSRDRHDDRDRDRRGGGGGGYDRDRDRGGSRRYDDYDRRGGGGGGYDRYDRGGGGGRDDRYDRDRRGGDRYDRGGDSYARDRGGSSYSRDRRDRSRSRDRSRRDRSRSRSRDRSRRDRSRSRSKSKSPRKD